MSPQRQEINLQVNHQFWKWIEFSQNSQLHAKFLIQKSMLILRRLFLDVSTKSSSCRSGFKYARNSRVIRIDMRRVEITVTKKTIDQECRIFQIKEEYIPTAPARVRMLKSSSVLGYASNRRRMFDIFILSSNVLFSRRRSSILFSSFLLQFDVADQLLRQEWLVWRYFDYVDYK